MDRNGLLAITKRILLLIVKINRSFLPLFLILIIISNILWIINEDGPKDFGAFVESGKAFVLGENPYADIYPAIYRPVFQGVEIASPNLNPPFSVLFFTIFHFLGGLECFRIWQIISFLFFVAGIFLLSKNSDFPIPWKRILWFFATAGIWHTIELGQIYSSLFFFISIIFLRINKVDDFLPGVLIGLICGLKPNFLIIVGLLFIGGYFRLSIISLLTWLITVLIPWIIGGSTIYSEWISASIKYQGIGFPGNSTIIGFAQSLQHPSGGIILAAIGIFAIMMVVFLHRPEKCRILQIGLLSSILFSPIGWPGYMVVVFPGLITKIWNRATWIFAVFLTLPIVLFFAIYNSLPVWKEFWSWWYGFAFLGLLILECWPIDRKQVS